MGQGPCRFCRSIHGTDVFVLVDAHSKWPEVVPMSSTTSAQTITVLRNVFSCYGIPQQLVSDNGPQFTSAEFASFCRANGIKHIRTAPYHPASNGLAERFVQSFKMAMRKAEKDGLPFSQRLATFLLTYRTTPHATTNVAPCVLFLGRTVRTRLDMLRPDGGAVVAEKQSQQKERHDKCCNARQFREGQAVMVRDFHGSAKWLEGIINKRLGPVTYLVKLPRGDVRKRHVDHIQERFVDEIDTFSHGGEERDLPVSPVSGPHPVVPSSVPDESEEVAQDESMETPVVESRVEPSVPSAPPIDHSWEPVTPWVPLPLPAVAGDTESTPCRNPLRARRAPARFQQTGSLLSSCDWRFLC